MATMHNPWQRLRDTLGLTSTGYWQQLNRLLDDPEAAVLAPVVVNRLRRIRDRRRR